MAKKVPSLETKKQVYQRWRGKCAFCGIDLPIEQHHIIAIKDDPSLIDDPENLIILCSNHHALTQKLKPDGKHCISFIDIKDLKRSKYATANKTSFSFDIPQNFQISLGSNLCSNCPYILVVNDRPLLEIWPQKPVYYTNEERFYLYMRFFDEENNFIGGMFANYWASVVGEEWNFKFTKTIIELKHKTKDVYVKFDKTPGKLIITGIFYFDGIKIEAKEDSLILPGNNKILNSTIFNCEVAFKIFGNKTEANIGIGSSLMKEEFK